MLPKIIIAVEKPNVPSGMVLAEDAASLSSGLHDSLARLIQRQLGFPWRAKLKDQAKRLTRVALTGISEGSGVLQFESLPTAGAAGRSPASIAAFDLVAGIRTFADSHQWPPYLPAIVRNRIGAAVAPIFNEPTATVSIAIEGDGLEGKCEISAPIKEALQTPEQFSPEEPVEVVGTVFDLNIRNHTFKVDTGSRNVTLEVSEAQFRSLDTDPMRWARVFVTGLPKDGQCRTVYDVKELRLANADEEDGLNVPSELRRGERSTAYQEVLKRSQDLLQLPEGWDSYGAQSPGRRGMVFATNFLRDVIGVLIDHKIDVPPPFLVPTAKGGVQFEWKIGPRELELEIPEKGRFEYLAVDGSKETEGEASRWTAVRLVRWVVTGEEV